MNQQGRKILNWWNQYDIVKKDYLDLFLVFFDSDLNTIEAVGNGQADGYIGTLILGRCNILHRRLLFLKIVGPTPFDDYPISMGGRSDWHEFASIIWLGSITE